MLLSFGARNFFSFKEGFEISFELSSGCPESISRSESVSRALAIIGANASGKTNAIRALVFLTNFCCNSFDIKPEDDIEVTPFYSNEAPTVFFADFMIDNTRYYYEIELTVQGIIRERLDRKVQRKSPVFERDAEKITYCIDALSELKKIKLRKKVSLISLAHQYEIKGLEKVYTFFSGITYNIDPYFGDIAIESLPLYIFNPSEKYAKSKDLLDFTIQQLKDFDTGVDDITIKQLKRSDLEDTYIPFFIHKTGNKNMRINSMMESNGTRSLYTQLILFKQALDCGGVLILDEFDNSLHPDILNSLIELFLNPEKNIKGAQLIFSTHNTAIMDKLSKYRIVLVNKEDNESFLYRVDELPGNIVRNDRSLENLYKTGKIGGKPNL